MTRKYSIRTTNEVVTQRCCKSLCSEQPDTEIEKTKEVTLMDHYINVQNSDCLRAIFDNCIKTDSGDTENLLIDFSPFANEKDAHEMDLIGKMSQIDIENERASVNKREDCVTVSSNSI